MVRLILDKFLLIRMTCDFITCGHIVGRTKAAATNMGLWQVGADGSY
jgi:hypothetical protein